MLILVMLGVHHDLSFPMSFWPPSCPEKHGSIDFLSQCLCTKGYLHLNLLQVYNFRFPTFLADPTASTPHGTLRHPRVPRLADQIGQRSLHRRHRRSSRGSRVAVPVLDILTKGVEEPDVGNETGCPHFYGCPDGACGLSVAPVEDQGESSASDCDDEDAYGEDYC